MKNVFLTILTMATLTACGPGFQATTSLAPIGVPNQEGGVVVGRAIIQVSAPGNYQASTIEFLKKINIIEFLKNILIPTAYASSTPGSGSNTVTFTNAPGVTFSLNVSGLAPTFTPTFTGETLNLGSVTISALTDNNLKVCGAGGTTKCTQAVIAMYTTGSTAGFVNTNDTYGVPVYAGTLNPTTPVGLLAANAVTVQQVTIAGSTNKQHLTDFPSPTYAVTSDFSNAGSGPYSMALVVEYVLNP